MQVKEVDTVPSGPRRGRISQYQPVYDRLGTLADRKWLEITCETEVEFKKLLSSLRAHRSPKIRTRTNGSEVIYAQERR